MTYLKKKNYKQLHTSVFWPKKKNDIWKKKKKEKRWRKTQYNFLLFICEFYHICIY